MRIWSYVVQKMAYIGNPTDARVNLYVLDGGGPDSNDARASATKRRAKLTLVRRNIKPTAQTTKVIPNS